jgi:hypothetical protein
MTFMGDLRNKVGLVSGIGGAPPKGLKVKLLGRERVVIVKGRHHYVTINGELLPMTKARQMDKEYKLKQKKKETDSKKKAPKKAPKKET